MSTRASQVLHTIATAVLVLCALVITGLLIRRELAAGARTEQTGVINLVPDWQRYANGVHRKGAKDASVTIVEFSDFECPYCRVAAARLDSLVREVPGVAVEYRHFPLPEHDHAVMAARASECAGVAGRFWEMHDVLFRAQDSLGMNQWGAYAERSGVTDLASFERCMTDGSVALSAIEADLQAARELSISATPTFLINKYRVVGVPSMDSLRVLVTRARSRD